LDTGGNSQAFALILGRSGFRYGKYAIVHATKAKSSTDHAIVSLANDFDERVRND
jgi:hypothetical protein